MNQQSRKNLGLLISIFALLISCQPSEAATPNSGELPISEQAPPALPVAGSYYDRAMAGEFSGTVVTISSPLSLGAASNLLDSVAQFEEISGIDIQLSGSQDFETEIGGLVEAGMSPDIANFPQPGFLASFVSAGEIVDVGEYLDSAYLEKQYDPSWLQMATMAGPDGPIMAGVWHRYSPKSIVWYPKAAFDRAGYEVPHTWEELILLSDRIVADGHTPWCIGMESGAATGWPATDWIEDILLRTTSLDNYDAWVRGELPFSSEEVRNAVMMMAEIFLTDGYVYGGQQALVSTYFGDSADPMFDNPPGCWLHRQGMFISSFFPPEMEPGIEFEYFYFPPIDQENGKPFLIGGDIMAQFNDRPEVRAVMEFFTRGESVSGWFENGGVLSPHRDTRVEWYKNDVDRGVAALAAEATSFRFDGSDLMPGEVGAGSFWQAMMDYLSGSMSLEEALAEIDASWPEEVP